MNSLIITAHPSTRGFARQIASRYQAARKQAGHKAEIIDLYSTRYRQDWLAFENVAHWPTDPKIQQIQKKIQAADELVFAFPIWWYEAPAILKNFFDLNFTSHFAYRYSDRGLPIGLLDGKTARFFATCDGPAWYYFLTGLLPRRAWRARLSFCGVATQSFDVLADKRNKTKADLEKFLDLVALRAQSN